MIKQAIPSINHDVVHAKPAVSVAWCQYRARTFMFNPFRVGFDFREIHEYLGLA
jgi:hypothetical protein